MWPHFLSILDGNVIFIVPQCLFRIFFFLFLSERMCWVVCSLLFNAAAARRSLNRTYRCVCRIFHLSMAHGTHWAQWLEEHALALLALYIIGLNWSLSTFNWMREVNDTDTVYSSVHPIYMYLFVFSSTVKHIWSKPVRFSKLRKV